MKKLIDEVRKRNMNLAHAKSVLGSTRAGTRAEVLSPGWTYLAALAIRNHAKGRKPFKIEEVALSFPDRPPDGRAWGHAARAAQRYGWIRRVGYAPAASSNGSPKCLWEAAR
jgi:uncharacterized protein (DUF934 family)